MLHVVFSASHPFHPNDRILARIEAKKALWIHVASILPELRFAGLSHGELIDQIIRDCIDKLHPAYSGPEIFNEIQTTAITFMIPRPKDIDVSFTTIYYNLVLSKIKHGQKDKGEKDDHRPDTG